MVKKALLSLFILSSVVAPVYANTNDAPVIGKVVITNRIATRNSIDNAPATKDVYLMPVKLTKRQREVLAKDIARPERKTFAREVVGDASSSLPSSVDVSMNGVPVMNQGQHGSCVTFAMTAALDAMLGKGDYISQLCSLELGSYLSKRGYTPSGWNNTYPQVVLHQIAQFGIVSKQSEAAGKCSGVTEYPLYGAPEGGVPISLDDYKSISENLVDYTSDKYFSWETELSFMQRFDWTGNDSDKFVEKIKQLLNTLHVEQGSETVDMRIVTAVLLPVRHCSTGACGRYHATDDTWVMSDEIINDPKPELGGHEMVVTGYDDNATVVDHAGATHKGIIKLRNSFGANSGDKGEYYMTYDFYKRFVTSVHSLRLARRADDY